MPVSVPVMMMRGTFKWHLVFKYYVLSRWFCVIGTFCEGRSPFKYINYKFNK